MTFDSLSKYTEESIKCVKEAQKFIQLRAQLEAEHVQKLLKLYQSTLTTFTPATSATGQNSSGSLLKTLAGASTADLKNIERNQVLSSSLWWSFTCLLQKLIDECQTQKRLLSEVETEITMPLSSFAKQMEQTRKTMLDDGQQLTAALQDTYTNLKKAKQAHDDSLASVNDAKEAYLKATRTPMIKEKELDRLNQKLQAAQERCSNAEEIYKNCEAACRVAQSQYWEHKMPILMQTIYDKEEERCDFVREKLINWLQIDRKASAAWLQCVDEMSGISETIDLSSDMEEIFTEHLGSIDESVVDSRDNKSVPVVSVRSLLNPIKAGRLLKKSDENDSSWKTRYFVLMGDRGDPYNSGYNISSSRLYYFESEDSLKPLGIIELAGCSICSVDSSLFQEKHNLFVITTTSSSLRIGKDQQNQGGKQRFSYFSAESNEEKQQWMQVIKKHALCCVKCIETNLAEPCSLSLYQNSGTKYAIELPKPSVQEQHYRQMRTARLNIMEGRDFQFLDPHSGQQGGYVDSELFTSFLQRNASFQCVISLKSNTGLARLAKTSLKASSSPFWGEEFLFDSLPECAEGFRISLLIGNGRRKDSISGYCDLNLNELFSKPDENLNVSRKWEGWLPLTPIDKEQSRQSIAYIRATISFVEETIMPLYEYPQFIECICANEFQNLRMLSKVAEKVTVFARDDFAKSLVAVLISTKMDFQCIRALVSLDLELTEDPNIVFRGNTLATKTLDRYMKMVGGEYLQNTLSGPLNLVIERCASKQESCEVDPTRIENCTDDILRKHHKRLLNLIQVFWSTIQGSIEKCPNRIRQIMSLIKEAVIHRFSSSASPIQHSAITGFIFLRFFCPAILNPKLFGITNDISENQQVNRALTLIAKVIQNLANLTEFKAKEPHMEFANNWIQTNTEPMKSFVVVLSTPTTATSGNNLPCPIDTAREINNMYMMINSQLSELEIFHKTNEATIYNQSLPALLEGMESTKKLYNSYRTKWLEHKNEISGLTHISQAFGKIDAPQTDLSYGFGVKSGLAFKDKKHSSMASGSKEQLQADSSTTPITSPHSTILTSSSNQILSESNHSTNIRFDPPTPNNLSSSSESVAQQAKLAEDRIQQLPISHPVPVKQDSESTIVTLMGQSKNLMGSPAIHKQSSALKVDVEEKSPKPPQKDQIQEKKTNELIQLPEMPRLSGFGNEIQTELDRKLTPMPSSPKEKSILEDLTQKLDTINIAPSPNRKAPVPLPKKDTHAR